MSKISCVAARKHDLSGGFANVWDGVLNSFNLWKQVFEVAEMFEKKQIIYSETQGVCQVENIVSLSAVRGQKGTPYYVLRPIYEKDSVSYIPVEV